ncbi:MAG: hypothetical protein QW734_02875 [Candidatus Bathyarchaeia archaeon]
MAERKPLEVSNAELILLFGIVAMALFILAGGMAQWFDPLTAGLVIVFVSALFLFAQFLESRGIFAGQTAMAFMVLVMGVTAILTGLISKGYLPLVLEVGTTFPLTAILYALAIAVVGIAVYTVLKKRK